MTDAPTSLTIGYQSPPRHAVKVVPPNANGAWFGLTYDGKVECEGMEPDEALDRLAKLFVVWSRGFTRADVVYLRALADSLRQERKGKPSDDSITSLPGERCDSLASRIAALLPPETP